MVFIEGSFTLSLSGHMSFHVVLIHIAAFMKYMWGLFFFSKHNACLCLHRVIQSSWWSPSYSTPPQHVVLLPLSKMCLCCNMIKDPVGPQSDCGISSQSEADLIHGEQISD